MNTSDNNNPGMAREERQWRESGPGRLFSQLETMGRESGERAEIKDKWGTHKAYNFGSEQADLIVHLQNGGVGERGGELVSCIECCQYKTLDWWKRAIDETEGVQVVLLDTPLIVALQEADIPEDKKWMFNAGKVAEMYATGKDKEQAMKTIFGIMMETVRSVVAPDFDVKIYDGALRLVPLTEEARKSRTENNETYKNTIQKLKRIPELLEQEYKNIRL